MSFSPDGTRIVTASDDKTATVWDARTGTILLELKGHTSYLLSVAFSPDGTRIVTASQDSTAKVWDARTATPLLEMNGHMGRVLSVSFSPDGTRIVTGSQDSTAKVWDARTATLAARARRGTRAACRACLSAGTAHESSPAVTTERSKFGTPGPGRASAT